MKVLISSQGSYFIRFLNNCHVKLVCDANITQILAIMNSFGLTDSKYEVSNREREKFHIQGKKKANEIFSWWI